MAGGGKQGGLITVLAAGAAGAAVVGTGGAVTPALLVAGGGAALGAGASVAGGIMQYQASQAESAQLKIAADREKLAAKQRAVEIREEMNRTLAAQGVMFAGRGIAPVGAPATLAERTRTDANIDLNINNLNSATTSREFKLRRQQVGLSGKAGLISGLGGAATTTATAI